MNTAQHMNDHAIAALLKSSASSSSAEATAVQELQQATQTIRSFLQRRDDYYRQAAATGEYSPQDLAYLQKQGRCQDLQLHAIRLPSAQQQEEEEIHEDFIAPCFFRFHFATPKDDDQIVDHDQEEDGDMSNVTAPHHYHQAQHQAPAAHHQAQQQPQELEEDMGALYAYAASLFNTGLAVHLSALDKDNKAPSFSTTTTPTSTTDRSLLRAVKYYEATYKILMSRDPAALPAALQQAIFMLLLAVCANSAACYRRLGNLTNMAACRQKLITLLTHCTVDLASLQEQAEYAIVQVAHIVAIAPLPVGAAMA